MDLLSTLLACSLYTADAPLVRAIAQSNSHGNPFSVVDPTLDYRRVEVPPEPTTLEAALARLSELASKGGTPLLGLMQVPAAWMTTFGRGPRDAFDACTNVSVGTAMLSALAHECAKEGAPRIEPLSHHRRRRLPERPVLAADRACVVRRYGEAIGMPEFELLISLELGAQRPAQPERAPVDAPIVFADPALRSCGADCILAPWAPSIEPREPPALGSAAASPK
jgi:Transglycosylase SLT domain